MSLLFLEERNKQSFTKITNCRWQLERIVVSNTTKRIVIPVKAGIFPQKFMTKIYLISPPKINLADFSQSLQSALETGLVPAFQLRLKDCDNQEILKSAQELKKICHDNNCLFLLNDSCQMALDAGADGVHLGVDDDSIATARKNSSKNFIIGASCYNSRHLAIEAAEQGADYLSFGAFFPTTTKIARSKATTEIIEWSREVMDLPVTAIGGITAENCAPLVKSGVDFLAVISFVWQHPQGVKAALQSMNKAIISLS